MTMPNETIDILTITQSIQFQPPAGAQPLILCAGADLQIAAEKQIKLEAQQGVRISKFGTANSLSVDGPVVVADGDVRIERRLGVGTESTLRATFDSPQGGLLNGLGIGLGSALPYVQDTPAQPKPYETIGTLSKTFSLRLYSYNSIIFHTKDPSATKMSLDQNGNLIVKGTLQVGKNITFENGLTVDTTFKSTVDASNDGYGGTPGTPGPRHPLTVLNNLNNNTSLVIEVDGSQNTGNLVLWWKVNGQKFKTELVGTPV